MTVQTFSAPVEPIPPTHQVGDPNHTPDHNSIVQVLTDYDGDIGNLQGAVASMFLVAGGNVCTITGVSTTFNTINLPTGNRDAAVDTLDVMCAGVKVFSLNGYGELRIFPALATHIAQVIKAQAGQTGDLFQLQDSNGNVMAKFTANGALLTQQPITIAQPGVSPIVAESWHDSPAMSNGWSKSGYFKYKKLPSNSVAVSIRNVRTAGGPQNNDNTLILPVGAIPFGWAPVSFQRFPVFTDIQALAAGTSGNNAEGACVQMNPDGSAAIFGVSTSAVRIDQSWAQYPLDV